MALETGTYISDLVSTNPASSDNISQGDDHIRLLKSTIKATFPNITGAVTPTQADLNKLTSSGSPQFSTIELGAASDTTISRVSAGLIAVEGGNVPLENRANTFTANQVISVTDNTNAALRVTQLGTGAAIRVEDSTNPDSTPFIVDASGKVGIGISAPANNLDVVGGTYFRGAAAAGAVFTIAPDATSGVNGVSLDTGYVSGGSGPLIFKNTGVERMRIDASGNVGIGTASPGAPLEVKGTNDPLLNLNNTGTGSNAVWFSRSGTLHTALYADNAGAFNIRNFQNSTISLWTNNTERLRINNNGDVGIGASPGAKLTLGGGGTDQYINREVNNGALIMTGGTGIVSGQTSAGIVLRGETSIYNPKVIEFFTNGAERMKVAADGTLYVNSANINMQVSDSGLCWGDFSTAVIGNAVSDYVKIITAGTEKFSVDSGGRLNSQATYDNTSTGSTVVVTSTGALRRTSSSIKYKKDVETLDHSLADNAIANLRPVWYRTKNAEGDDKASWSHIGLIAEEVDLVEKRLVRYKTVDVTYDEDGRRVETPLDKPEPEDVDYARLSVILLDKVQRMDATIKALEARIAALEAA